MKFQSGKASRKSVELTIYNNFAAVREVRSLHAESEIDYLIIKDLPAGIEADSFFVKGAAVLEQDYQDGIMDKNLLLKKYVGGLVTIRNAEAGSEIKIRLLKAEPDFIGEIEETGEILVNPAGDLILPPEVGKMPSESAITCRIEPLQGDAEIELYYLVSGLSWEANYIAELVEEDLILNGWIKIRNYAGGDFDNCRIKAVAGIFKRAADELPFQEFGRYSSNSISDGMRPSNFSEGEVYRVDGFFSLEENVLKQIQFLHDQHAGFQKIYRIENRNKNASVQLQFISATEGGVNLPLPAGTIKFFGRDNEEELKFIGEDRISHTAAKKKISVMLGETFDLTNESFEKSRNVTGRSEYVTFVYKIKNSKTKNAAVLVDHVINDHIWEMESSTHDYEVKDSHTLEFHVRMGAEKTVELEFTYKVKSR